jgi:cytoskeleton protein RodZ
MAALGTYLSRLRGGRGLSVEDVSRLTRVAPRYLEALEAEDFASLPAPVFTRGYIRAYCQALGASSDAALALYAETSEVAPPAATSAPRTRSTRAGPRENRRTRGTLLLSFVLLIGFGLALFITALFLQAGRPESGSRRAEPPSPRTEALPAAVTRSTPPVTSPPPSAAPGPAPATALPPVDEPPTPAAAVPSSPRARGDAGRAPQPKPAAPAPPRAEAARSAAPPGASESLGARLGHVISPYRLVARTSEQTWMRVRTEDGRATEETIPAGEIREWISNRPFVLTISNAAGVALELNGQKLPPLGGRGVAIGQLILPPTQP